MDKAQNGALRNRIIGVLHDIVNESVIIKPYVMIAQPRRDLTETPAQNFEGGLGIHVDVLGHSWVYAKIGGEIVDVARNYLIEHALNSGAKYLFFIGEDTVVPYDAFRRLHQTAEANPGSIVSGVYYMKLSSPMIMVRQGEYVVPANVDRGQILEAWQTGLDCCLIPTAILRTLKEEDPEMPMTCVAYQIEDLPFIGEDNFFVYRVRKNGFKILVNTDVQCLHMDLATCKYTAHPDVKMEDYITNMPIKGPLTMEDKKFIDKRWMDRIPKPQMPEDT